MDRKERYESEYAALMTAMDGRQSDQWTALPGVVQSFNTADMTCDVQPTIQAQVTSAENGSKSWINLPVLLDCPVFFPAGGGCTLTFPIVKGDECLVVFASRCIDAWWQSGGIQQQPLLRMHDLSDGFVFVGVRSKPRIISNISTATVQLRSDDGQAYFELHPTTHNVKVIAPGNVDITAPTVAITGNLTVSGTIVAQGDVTGQGTHLHTHVHSGVTTGSSNTGQPV